MHFQSIRRDVIRFDPRSHVVVFEPELAIIAMKRFIHGNSNIGITAYLHWYLASWVIEVILSSIQEKYHVLKTVSEQ